MVYVGTTIRELTDESVRQGMPRWLWISGLAAAVVVVGVIGAVAKRAVERVAG
jgi:uncharacterized membrane protein YdcZ (DUF606 family)